MSNPFLEPELYAGSVPTIIVPCPVEFLASIVFIAVPVPFTAPTTNSSFEAYCWLLNSTFSSDSICESKFPCTLIPLEPSRVPKLPFIMLNPILPSNGPVSESLRAGSAVVSDLVELSIERFKFIIT